MGRMMSGNVDGMIEYIHSLPGKDLSQTGMAVLLRLSVHVLLVMRDLEIPHNQESANEIIRQFVLALIEYHAVVALPSRI
jgi:hypothetical protein